MDHPNAMIRLASKLKAAKSALCKWNKEIFGDVIQNVKKAESEVELKQMEYDVSPSPENRSGLNEANANLR